MCILSKSVCGTGLLFGAFELLLGLEPMSCRKKNSLAHNTKCLWRINSKINLGVVAKMERTVVQAVVIAVA